jgi:glycyl-tRNA synthetase beta chain
MRKKRANATGDFLVEIGTEELPPRALAELSAAFADGVHNGLAAARLEHAPIVPFATPRRLALLVPAVAFRQPDQEIKRRGPPVSAAFDAGGKPTKAALAFATSCATSIEKVGRQREEKGEYLFYAGRQPGLAARDLLPAIVTQSLDALPIPKRMRWGAGTAEFVRPVHWVVMLHGREVVPATILGVKSGALTRGHRFHAPQPIRISQPAGYSALLARRGRVIASFAERREKIRAGVMAAARTRKLHALITDELLDEVTALVEWPVPIVGRFEDRFLELPREVLIATLEDHQRCFAMQNAQEKLATSFAAVSNIVSRKPERVVGGNERVVRSRLADAAFFWETDRKQSLASRIEALKSVTFQNKLGSQYDKTQRVKALTQQVATMLGTDAAAATRAAELAKCDLLTRLVGEFPELQGTMGAYFARNDGEPEPVAQAIGEQYRPRFARDALPASCPGVALAIADKLDTICGVFAIGQKPTGARDPFGLRRAALGVLRIAIECRLELDLKVLIAAGCAAQPVKNSLATDIYEYMMERLRAYYLEAAGIKGMTGEIFDAVLVNRPSSPLDFDARVRAVADFLALPEAPALTAANKRIANILRQAAKEPIAPFASIERGLFEFDEERKLFAALERNQIEVGELLKARAYGAAMQSLAALRAPVDAFFDAVMVMHDDPQVRSQRLGLLSAIRNLFMHTADLSRVGA